jgi:hypothetical protein
MVPRAVSLHSFVGFRKRETVYISMNLSEPQSSNVTRFTPKRIHHNHSIEVLIGLQILS